MGTRTNGGCLSLIFQGWTIMTNDYGKRARLASVFSGTILVLALQSPEISARTLGLVADNTESSVTIFDADTDTVLGSVPIPPGTIGDVLITPDQRWGFVTNFKNEVFVIDLAASPPRLAEGTNPTRISNLGEDLAISPDGKFLVVSDGNAVQPISVVDIESRTEIHTLSVDSDTNSVDVCRDGSVLVTSSTGTVRRLMIDSAGALKDTGETLLLDGEPNNVFCAPNSASGLVVTTLSGSMTSFTVPELKRVDTRALSGNFGISGLVAPDGDRVFVRSSYDGFVDVFSYDATTASLHERPQLSIPVSVTFGFYGIDQIALHPSKPKLYVPEYFANALNVYDANSGELLTSITDLHIVEPTGVTIATPADGDNDGAEDEDDGNGASDGPHRR
jgi:WD40 repeat protein